jgi:hypothetical protein
MLFQASHFYMKPGALQCWALEIYRVAVMSLNLHKKRHTGAGSLFIGHGRYLQSEDPEQKENIDWELWLPAFSKTGILKD